MMPPASFLEKKCPASSKGVHHYALFSKSMRLGSSLPVWLASDGKITYTNQRRKEILMSPTSKVLSS
jgi:hypothetical protein